MVEGFGICIDREYEYWIRCGLLFIRFNRLVNDSDVFLHTNSYNYFELVIEGFRSSVEIR